VLGPFSKELIFEKLRKEKFSLIIDETTDKKEFGSCGQIF
jgi:hypothetical protein